MQRQPRPRYVSLLVVAATGLALVNLWLLGTPIDVSPVTPPAGTFSPPDASGTDEVPSAVVQLGDLSEMVARPLFSPTRRAPAPQVETQPAAPTPVTAVSDARSLRLIGTMGEGGDASRRALIRPADRPAAWFEIGGEIDGWRVEKIGESSVVIVRGGDREELSLYAPAASEDVPGQGDANPGSR
jgi:hypothetical protein